MPYLKTQQVNFLGILSEWGPDPLRPLPNFYLSDFYLFFFSKILGHPKQMIYLFLRFHDSPPPSSLFEQVLEVIYIWTLNDRLRL